MSPAYLRDPINRSHPLNRGRIAWWLAVPGLLGGPRWFDLCGNYHLTANGSGTTFGNWSGTTRPGGFGDFAFGGGSYGFRATPGTSPFSTAGANSGAAWVYFGSILAAGGTTQTLFGCGVSTGTGYNVAQRGTVGLGLFNVANGNTLVTSPSQPAAKLWYRVLWTCSPSGSLTLYLDGVPVATGTSVSSPVTVFSIFENANTNYAETLTSGSHLDDVTVWNRTLSAAEALQDYDISQQGYPGVLNPAAPRLLINPASVYGSTLLESLASGDGYAANFVSNPAFSEAVTPADGYAGAATLAPSFSEAVAAADLQSALATFAPPVGESLTAADALAALFAGNTPLAEAVAAGDVQSGFAILAPAISEAVAPGDSNAATGTFAPSLAEPILASDVHAGGLLLSVTVGETIAATDGHAAANSLFTALTESATATDGPAAGSAFNPALAEMIMASDVVLGSMLMRASLAESVAASDNSIAGSAFNPVFAESITASDFVPGYILMGGLISESAAATDGSIVGSAFNSALAESISASDTVPGSVLMGISLSESAAASDGFTVLIPSPTPGFRTLAAVGVGRVLMADSPARSLVADSPARILTADPH